MAHIPLGEQIETIDPAHAYDAVSLSVMDQVYERLYEYHYLKRPYELVPLLAEGYPRIDQKGTRYTIKIKKGVFYHDSAAFKGAKRPLKAIDFIHQIKRIALRKTKSNGWFLFKGRVLGLDEFREKANHLSDIVQRKVQGLQAPDDSTLVIELTRPYPQMLYVLAMSFASPMPYEAIEHYGNNIDQNPVATGPFKMVKWNRGLNVILEKKSSLQACCLSFSRGCHRCSKGPVRRQGQGHSLSR